MQIKRYLKIGLLLGVISIMAAAALLYSMQFAKAKQHYADQLQEQINQFIVQQNSLLQRLAKQMSFAVQQQDLPNIKLHLRSYEDLIFTLAKQNLTVPVNVHFVSLNAPQQIIGSNGKVDSNYLAPDEDYYSRSISEPNRLIFSGAYIKTEMPDHLLCNWGVGIIGQNYLGHLDVKAALVAIENYIQARVAPNELFSFQLSVPDLSKSSVKVNSVVFIAGLVKFVILCITGAILLYSAVFYLIKLYAYIKQQQQDISIMDKHISEQFLELSALKLATKIQEKYGILAANEDHSYSNIDIGQILSEVQTINTELAIARGVKIELVHDFEQPIHIYTNRLRLMQILSGITYSILQQLPDGSTLELQVILQELSNAHQKFLFKFTDNGFYTSLQDEPHVCSLADVRAKGWDYINDLVEDEDGILDHIHAAYSGNTVYFTIIRKVHNNVVHFNEYFKEIS